MAFGHGKTGYLEVEDAGGTSRNWSTYLDNIQSNLGLDLADSTTFGRNHKGKTPGLRDSKISFSGKFDATVDGYIEGIMQKATTSTAIYGPIGNTAGMIKYTLEVFLGSYDVTTPVADMTTISGTLEHDGNQGLPVRGTFS
jgi:hypothetical protein